jgi:quinoprotein dehydrogenase-associated probable ABC transporter substrate-binding protein
MFSRFRKVGPRLAIACVATLAPAVAGSDATTLRVCADPNNLPFSNQQQQGFENKIARAMAAAFGQRLEYVWWAQRRGFVRNTLNAAACDVLVGVPARFELALTTRPYYRSSYVFVTRGADLHLSGLDDARLRSMTIGVHLIGDDFANVPPAHALANRGMIGNVRGYSVYGDYSQPDPPAALVRAVAGGALDVAIAWGPLAGYFARHSSVPLTVTPVPQDPHTPSLPFAYDIAMGVRRGDIALKRKLDTFITQHRRELDRLLADYGVPRVDTGAPR